jgi:hypothetical protein
MSFYRRHPKMSSSTIPTPRLITLSLAACVGAVAIAFAFSVLVAESSSSNALIDDPNHYQRISRSIIDGAIPYVDGQVEHLPGALVPMLGAELIVTVLPLRFFSVWVALMTACIVASAVLWRRVDVDFDAGVRFLALSAALLPVVLFRVEPWVVFLASLAIVLAFEARWVAGSVATVAAALSKGWPVVLFLLPYQAGRRRIALISGSISVLGLVWVAFLPGFQASRSFDGIHTETFVGSLLLVFRHMTDAELGVMSDAGAAYVTVGVAGPLINAAIGAIFLVVAVYAAMKTRSLPDLLVPVGLSVFAIVVGSPLFSAQFVFWLVPFVMFLGLTQRRLFLGIAVLTTLSVAGWSPLDLSWALTVVLRNGILFALGVTWVVSALGPLRVGTDGADSETVSEQLS